MTIATDLPAKLTFTPQLPELRGTSNSTFEFQLSIKNDSGKKLLVSLSAQAPPNFDATFTEQYGSQELNAAAARPGPVKGRQAQGAAAEHGRRRQIQGGGAVAAEDATATTDLALDITGQPKIDMAGREGVLSAKAIAGTETSIPVLLINTGTAPAEQVELSGSAPRGWKIDVRAEGHRSHRAQREEGSAGAGDADRQGDRRRLRHHHARSFARRDPRRESSASRCRPRRCGASSASRIIGVALLVMVGAVARFGRR